MGNIVMSTDEEKNFSAVVDQFLEQCCKRQPDLHIPDRVLFPAFRAFWAGTTNEHNHPALLGQFRVEMTQRGYRSNGVKKPRWYGLTLKTVKKKA
jgi:hypothetical protein